MSDIWLIIWRFQPFHNGHKLLIDTSLSENKSTLVLIWSSNVANSDNPYSYDLRKKIIKANIKDQAININALPDFPDDVQWWEYILSYIPKDTEAITLYFWDENSDSAIKSIKNMQNIFPCRIIFKEIPRSIIPISATQVREAITNQNNDFLNVNLSKNTLEILRK